MEIKVVDLARINARPGDTFLMRIRDRVSHDAVERLREQWHEHFPDNPVVVLSGADIEVEVLCDETKADD